MMKVIGYVRVSTEGQATEGVSGCRVDNQESLQDALRIIGEGGDAGCMLPEPSGAFYKGYTGDCGQT